VNGQIQYGSARPVTSPMTPTRRYLPRVADPARFRAAESTTSRSVMLLFGGSLLLGGLLAAVPREIPGIAVATILGGAWLSVVLALTLPSRSERAGAELTRRLGQFRHEVNAVGDAPTRRELETLITRARELDLRDSEIAAELAQIHASLDALELATRLEHDDLPVVHSDEPLAPGDLCHMATPVRFGRRRSDQFGHMLLTSGWLKFRGSVDMSVAWTEVADVQRAGREVIVSLQESNRVVRFTCHGMTEAARAGILAQYLANSAGPRHVEQDPAPHHAAL